MHPLILCKVTINKTYSASSSSFFCSSNLYIGVHNYFYVSYLERKADALKKNTVNASMYSSKRSQ